MTVSCFRLVRINARCSTLPPSSLSFYRSRFTHSRRHFTTSSINLRGPPYNVLFFGSDDFSIASFKALLDLPSSVVNSLEVVTRADRPVRTRNASTSSAASTSTPLSTFARSSGIPVHHAPYNKKSLSGWTVPSPSPSPSPSTSSLQSDPPAAFDLAIVSSFGMFIPQSILKSFKQGAINIHPSLLPQLRGPAPIQHAILQGMSQTGVSIQYIHPKIFDGGKILLQRQFEIDNPECASYSTLQRQLAALGGDMLKELVVNYETISSQAWTQDENNVTYAPPIIKDSARIAWEAMDCDCIYRMHRAFGHMEPLHAVFKLSDSPNAKGLRCQLIGISPLDKSSLSVELQRRLAESDAVKQGTIIHEGQRTGKQLFVKTLDGNWLVVDKLRVEGKKTVSSKDFINGYQPISGQACFDTAPLLLNA